jgi:hypothetical protein
MLIKIGSTPWIKFISTSNEFSITGNLLTPIDVGLHDFEVILQDVYGASKSYSQVVQVTQGDEDGQTGDN